MASNPRILHLCVFVGKVSQLTMPSSSCPSGGFPIIRHNEFKDLTADLMSEVCHDVQTEPDLQLITGEIFSKASVNKEDGARLL